MPKKLFFSSYSSLNFCKLIIKTTFFDLNYEINDYY